MKKLVPVLLVALVILASSDVRADGLTHESELAIASSSGNSDSQTFQVKQLTGYVFEEKNTVKLGGHYLYGQANGVEAAKNWDVSLRYERSLSEPLGVFAANAWESDIFIGYDYRTNADLGAKYYIIPGDKKVNYLEAELGYRYQFEHHNAGIVPESLTAHIVRGYLEGVIAITSNTQAKAWVELLPDLANGSNFQSNFEGSVSVALNDTLSLKVAYLGRYRNLPLGFGRKKYDSLITSALIAKF